MTDQKVTQEAIERANRVVAASQRVRDVLDEVMKDMDSPTTGATGAYVMTTLAVWLRKSGLPAEAIYGMIEAAIESGSGVLLCDPSERVGAPKPSLIEEAPAQPERVGDLSPAERAPLLAIRAAAAQVASFANHMAAQNGYSSLETITFCGYLMTNFALALRGLGLEDSFIVAGFQKALETGNPVAMASDRQVSPADPEALS